MELAAKAFAVCVLSASAAILIKKDNPAGALLLSAAAAAVMLAAAFGYVLKSVEFFRRVLELTGVSSALAAPVLKCAGIAVITKFGGDICRDAGESALASKTEICGRILMVAAALPVLTDLLGTLSGLAGEYL